METDVLERTCGLVLWGVSTFQRENAYFQNAFGHACTDIQLCRTMGHSLSPFDAHALFPKARE